MKTYGDLFSGFGGASIGAKAAGLELAFGLELDPTIAEVGNFNLGGHIRVGNILDAKATNFDRVDVLHMSPPCVRASVANSSGELNEDGLRESPLDIALAEKCIEFITTLQPDVVTLENVWGYRLFQSWRGGKKTKGIQQALYDAGYWLHCDHVNAADYGVAQTRKRMIVRAIRGGFVPYLPQPVPWVGWYSAIENILHTLPESRFADWQLARLPKELQSMLVAQGGYDGKVVTARQDEPSFTVTANSNQTGVRALLVSNAKTEFSDGTREAETPSLTVTGESNGRLRPVLMDLGNTSRAATIIDESDPSMTVTSWHGRRPSHMPAAFIVDCQNAGNPSPDRERGLTIRNGDQPCFTLTSSMGQKRPTRAFDGGKVVNMTPRALARFQGFPDWYQLPDSKTLAAKGIGNAVPPLMYQRILEGLLA